MVFQSRSTWAWPYALFMLCLVILPLVLIGVYAFTDAQGHFTIQNFVSFFTKSEAINTFIYSLAISGAHEEDQKTAAEGHGPAPPVAD